MDTVEKLNVIYSKHAENCDGSFHNALWQIMINESCEGAFSYSHTSKQVIIALPEGGYIPALFDIPNKEKRQLIIDDLNREIFDLNAMQAMRIECDSMKGASAFIG